MADSEKDRRVGYWRGFHLQQVPVRTKGGLELQKAMVRGDLIPVLEMDIAEIERRTLAVMGLETEEKDDGAVRKSEE